MSSDGLSLIHKAMGSHPKGIEGFSIKSVFYGVPVMAQWLTNPTRNHEVPGSIPGLAQ